MFKLNGPFLIYFVNILPPNLASLIRTIVNGFALSERYSDFIDVRSMSWRRLTLIEFMLTEKNIIFNEVLFRASVRNVFSVDSPSQPTVIRDSRPDIAAWPTPPNAQNRNSHQETCDEPTKLINMIKVAAASTGLLNHFKVVFESSCENWHKWNSILIAPNIQICGIAIFSFRRLIGCCDV